MSKAEQFLQQIGFDNSHLPEIFNDDDKSFYTIANLIQEYADQEVEKCKQEINIPVAIPTDSLT